jgi:hypothetical protein
MSFEGEKMNMYIGTSLSFSFLKTMRCQDYPGIKKKLVSRVF